LIRLRVILKLYNGILAQFEALLKFFEMDHELTRNLPAHGWKALFGQNPMIMLY
jgi:hypothetical protein